MLEVAIATSLISSALYIICIEEATFKCCVSQHSALYRLFIHVNFSRKEIRCVGVFVYGINSCTKKKNDKIAMRIKCIFHSP